MWLVGRQFTQGMKKEGQIREERDRKKERARASEREKEVGEGERDTPRERQRDTPRERLRVTEKQREGERQTERSELVPGRGEGVPSTGGNSSFRKISWDRK